MVPEYLQEVKLLERRVTDEKYLRLETVAAFAIRELEDYSKKCAELEKKAEKINDYQRVLELHVNRFE